MTHGGLRPPWTPGRARPASLPVDREGPHTTRCAGPLARLVESGGRRGLRVPWRPERSPVPGGGAARLRGGRAGGVLLTPLDRGRRGARWGRAAGLTGGLAARGRGGPPRFGRGCTPLAHCSGCLACVSGPRGSHAPTATRSRTATTAGRLVAEEPGPVPAGADDTHGRGTGDRAPLALRSENDTPDLGGRRPHGCRHKTDGRRERDGTSDGGTEDPHPVEVV